MKRKLTTRQIKDKTRTSMKLILIIAIGMSYLFLGAEISKTTGDGNVTSENQSTESITEEYEDGDIDGIAEYGGFPYTVINYNLPNFTDSEKNNTETYYEYSKLDKNGRCGEVLTCIGRNTLKTQERGEIGRILPSGWHSIKADDVDGGWLYNRSHLIASCLGGPCGRDGESEDELKRNLITGTRYMNVEGMEHFELMIRDYIYETDNHVLYRVTPVYKGNNLVASGVQMEAYSIEDCGTGITFNVFCYNVQPGYEIDYATGNARKE